MRVADLLNLDAPLPKDPFEALLLTRARMARLQARTIEVMTTIYPDYERVIGALCTKEEELSTALGSFAAEGLA